MARLIDTNLWIGLTRARSPRAVKAFVALQVLDPQACLAEPIIFEVLRKAISEHPILASTAKN